MLSQALCRLCSGNGHHRTSLFCAFLSPLQAVLQAAHVIFVCFCVKGRRFEDRVAPPETTRQRVVQRFQHLHVALQLKHGVERGVGSLRNKRACFQVEARRKKRARQSLQRSVD